MISKDASKNIGRNSQYSRTSKVFISYSRMDNQISEKIFDFLDQIDGLDPFVDKEDILVGEEWRPRLEELILSSDAVVSVISNAYLKSEICMWEFHYAKKLNKKIIPIIISRGDVSKLPVEIAGLNLLSGEDPLAFNEALERIVSEIDLDVEWIREHTRLLMRATRWLNANRARSHVMRGNELKAAEIWSASQPNNQNLPTNLHLSFINASRDEARNRVKLTVTGAVIISVLMSAISGWAFQQRNIAREERTKALETYTASEVAMGNIIFDMVNRFRNSDIPIETRLELLRQVERMRGTMGSNFPDIGPTSRNTYLSYLEKARYHEEEEEYHQAKLEYEAALKGVMEHDLNANIMAVRDSIIILQHYASFIPKAAGSLTENQSKFLPSSLNEAWAIIDGLHGTMYNSEYYGLSDAKSRLDTVGIKIEVNLAQEKHGHVAQLYQALLSEEMRFDQKFSSSENYGWMMDTLAWNGAVNRRLVSVALAKLKRYPEAVSVAQQAITLLERFRGSYQAKHFSESKMEALQSELQAMIDNFAFFEETEETDI